MRWGASTYTVIRVPDALVDAARAVGTRRVAGALDEVEVNLALTRAPVLPDAFLWADPRRVHPSDTNNERAQVVIR